jgi:sugar phosphate isomerase/epimerase
VSLVVPDIGLGCANLLQLSLPEFIDTAGDAGFRRITVRPYAYAQALADGWTEADLRDRLSRHEITVTMIDALSSALPGIPDAGDLDPSVRARLPADVSEPPDEDTCIRTATALGAPILNVTHYLGSPQPIDVLGAALAGVCLRCAALAVSVCVEFVPESGIPDLQTARAVVEACGQPNCAILLDLFHLDRSGGTVDDIHDLPPDSLAGIQLSDRHRPGHGTSHVPLSGRRLPGEGEMPLSELVAAGLANSPGATVDIEVLNDELRSLPAGQAAAALAAAARSWRSSLDR